MKRITQDVSKWHVILGREARGLDPADAQDQAGQQFQDELFDRLYAGEPEVLPADQRVHDARTVQWAEGMHEAAGQLPAFQRLAAQVRGDAVQAGFAVDQLVKALGPQASGPAAQNPRARQDPKTQQDQARRALQQAVMTAQTKLDEAMELLEGLECVAFGRQAGSGDEPGQQTRMDGELLRRLVGQAGQHGRLARIARMAGRFKAVASQKAKSRVDHGADEIVDVAQGADLDRVLTGALVRLRHPVLKLAFLRDFHERALQQYRMTGQDTLGRGPVVVLLDKSSSMWESCGNGGPSRDEWATAVMLALLDQAAREHRTFCVITFAGQARSQTIVRAGDRLPVNVLLESADGSSTRIDEAYRAALAVVAAEPSVGKADLMILTDGESHQAPDHDALRAQAQAAGITTYGIGIAVQASCLAPWCDVAESVDPTDRLDDNAAAALFARAA